jgi:hypothetical protein
MIIDNLILCSYGVGKKIFCDDDAFDKLKLTQIALAGATSAAFTTPILAPGAAFIHLDMHEIVKIFIHI